MSNWAVLLLFKVTATENRLSDNYDHGVNTRAASCCVKHTLVTLGAKMIDSWSQLWDAPVDL